METVYPTIDISILENKGYKILGLTINPLFKVERENELFFIGKYSSLSHFLPPKNKYQVWIELVLGHDSEEALDFPQIKFSFNAALKCNNNDRLYRGEIKSSGYPIGNGINFEIYRHFWLNNKAVNLLKSAYGADAERIIPNDYCNAEPIVAMIKEKFDWPNDTQCGDARFALAFTRSSYRLTPSEMVREVKTDLRLNYPCTFQIISESGDAATTNDVILQPRPYELDTWSPSFKKQMLNKNESISFWFHYGYGEQTAKHADAPDHDMFSFINNITLNNEDFDKSSIDTNCFPRFPHRFQVHHSEPRLIVSPRLDDDPRPWQCSSFAMYPMVVGKKIELQKDGQMSSLSCFFGIRDERTLMERNVGAVIYGLILGILLNFIASIAMGNSPDFTDMVLLCILGVISGIFVYLILAVLMGRVDGANNLFRFWEQREFKAQLNSNADFKTLGYALVICAEIIAIWFFSGSVGHFWMVILVSSLIVSGMAVCGLTYYYHNYRLSKY